MLPRVSPELPSPGRFPETRWSRILRQRDAEGRRRAIDDICRSRWRALYAYARRRGLNPAEAEDAVQGLLLRLVEHDFLAKVDPARGRLRSYLLRALDNHLANRHEARVALKRGGGVVPLSFELAEAELAANSSDPALAFDREWALAVFERALAQLEAELLDGERVGPVEVLRQLFRFGDVSAYETLALEHGLSVTQLKSFVCRSKRRFRALLLRELGDTVERAEDAESELGELLACLTRSGET